MVKKYLIVSKEKKCIGCNLCVLASLRYKKRALGIKDSQIAIKGRPGSYKIQIDYGANIYQPERIVKLCPQNCFDIIVDKK